MADNEGALPIHCAVLIDLLTGSNPDGVLAYDQGGCLLFHLKNVSSARTSRLYEEVEELEFILLLVRHSLEMFTGNMLSRRGDEPTLLARRIANLDVGSEAQA